jgi:hypothetical protein
MRRALLCLAASAAVACSTALGAFAGSSTPRQTKIIVYSPFTIDGQLSNGVRVIRSLRGDCWEGSVVSQRSDAWRCLSGNQILDPCNSGAVTWVACARDWFGRSVIKLVLTKSLLR